MTLYILGNGFDLAHELPTAYWDFRTYLTADAVQEQAAPTEENELPKQLDPFQSISLTEA